MEQVDSAPVSSSTILYRFGSPRRTGAVVARLPDTLVPSDLPKGWDLQRDGSVVHLRRALRADDRIFGLGESLGSLNKRGRLYRSFSAQEIPATPDRASTNGAHPILFAQGGSTWGLFVDYPSEIFFDIGFTYHELLHIQIPSDDFDLYFFDAPDALGLVRAYLELTGAPWVPPRWAFGYQQCRFSYLDRKEIEELGDRFRAEKIPCDAIYMDIDYMERYKVFTVDPLKFPEFPSFVGEMRTKGFELVPIVDPGVRVEAGYPVYESGLSGKRFCTKDDGSLFFASVWPGYTHMPDFLDPEVRAWWGDQYRFFTDAGVVSFWNDMNEPQFWYTPESFQSVGKIMTGIDETLFLGTESIEFKQQLTGFWQNEKEYRRFFHRTEDGELVNHWDVHNLYGYNMVLAGTDGLERLAPGKRYFMVSRSSTTGMHRFSSVWTGDNDSWWEHLIVNLRMVLGLNMAGFLYCGADVGGHQGDVSPELLIRWTQLGAFIPLFRNHSAKGTRRQEPWEFGEEVTASIRDIIRLRYAFLPYAYSEFMQARRELRPFVAPLFTESSAERCLDIEDQFMYGRSVMVAPVLQANARGRFIHLPDGPWLEWSAARWEERTFTVAPAGDRYVEAPLSRIPIYLKRNALVPLAEPMSFTRERPISELVVVGYVPDAAAYRYYEDDGESRDYLEGGFSETEFTVGWSSDGTLEAAVSRDERGGFRSPLEEVRFEIHDGAGRLHRKSLSIRRT